MQIFKSNYYESAIWSLLKEFKYRQKPTLIIHPLALHRSIFQTENEVNSSGAAYGNETPPPCKIGPNENLKNLKKYLQRTTAKKSCNIVFFTYCGMCICIITFF